ncbi:MAG: hypothetical protein ACXVAK_08835 [Vulcanimicrobiaceae bacterium]
MDERHLPHDKDDVEDIKPDIIEFNGEEKLPPDEALRREIDTYGESDMDPNRQDQEDAHRAGPDEHL